jgi:hypothetical protein
MAKDAKLVITAEDKTKQAFASLQRSLGGIQQHLTSFKGELLGLVGVTGFGAMIHSALEAGEHIEKLSVRLGASTEALSQYQHVAELSNVSFDSLTRGWQFMSKNVSEAAIGIGKASGVLQELGLSATQLNQLKPEAKFEVLADAISKVQNPADRVRMAMRLFGKQGAELIPILANGAQGIRAARNEADKLGLTLTENAAHDMAAAHEALVRLKTAFHGLANTLAVQCAPALAGIAETLSEYLPVAAQKTAIAFTYTKQAVALAIATLVMAVEQLFKLWSHLPGRIGQAFKEAAQAADNIKLSLFHTTQQFGEQLNELNHHESMHQAALKQTSQVIKDNYSPALKELALQSFNAANATHQLTQVEKAHQKALEDAKRLIEEMHSPFEVYIAHLQETNQLLQQGLISHTTYQRALKSFQKELADNTGYSEALKENEQQAQEHVRQITDIFKNGFFAYLQEGFSGMVKSFENALSAMAADAASAEFGKLLFGSTASSAFKGSNSLLNQFLGDGFGKLFSFKSFGGFRANGGSITAGNAYIVGERGPELFLPKQSGSVVPNSKLSTNPIIINNYIQTPDIDSFRRSEGNIAASIKLQLEQAARRNL